MAILEIKVPDIGDFRDVPVIEVLVKPGDAVKKDASLVTLESDKATMEVPSTHSGTVKELKVKLGDRLSEGAVILLLESAEAAKPAPARPAPPRRAPPRRLRRRPQGRATVASRGAHLHPREPGCRPARRGACARRRARRVHRGLPRGGPRQEGRARGALRHAGRRVPQRGLHPVQGAAARREGHRGRRGHGRARRVVRPAENRHRRHPRLQGRRRRQAHQGPFEPRQGAQGHRGAGARQVHLRPCGRGGNEGGPQGGLLRPLHHRRGLAVRAHPRLSLRRSAPPRFHERAGAPGRPEAPAHHRRRHHRPRDGHRLRRARLEGDRCRVHGPPDSRRGPGHRAPASQADREALREDPPEDQGREDRGAQGGAARHL
ncbi:MAG: hypothetical protein IPH30_12930 [Betaproteobacteria bacterium]|nr:hypothetical protein [Betaproteobacteria bacterium]